MFYSGRNHAEIGEAIVMENNLANSASKVQRVCEIKCEPVDVLIVHLYSIC